MVRHDDECMKNVSISVKMLERLADDPAGCRSLENAGAVALIQIPVDLGGEEQMVFGFGFGWPGQWVELQPRVLFVSPITEEIGRKGIFQPEGDEIGLSVLLPVRKVFAGF